MFQCMVGNDTEKALALDKEDQRGVGQCQLSTDVLVVEDAQQ